MSLQVTGDEVRIGDAGTVDYAIGDGDLYVGEDLNVTADIDVHVGNCIVFPSGGQICDA